MSHAKASLMIGVQNYFLNPACGAFSFGLGENVQNACSWTLNPTRKHAACYEIRLQFSFNFGQRGKDEESLTASVSCTSSHYASHDDRPRRLIPPYGGSLGHRHTRLLTELLGSSFSCGFLCFQVHSSPSAHQRLLVLHQSDDLHRLLFQLVFKVIGQRR